MIDYESFCRIKALAAQGMRASQIARTLDLDSGTVCKYLRQSRFQPRKSPPSKSILDPFKPHIARILNRHPYSAVQILQMLRRDHGYKGGYTILKDHVRRVRPPRSKAYLTLHFDPGQAAQVDWGTYGVIPVGNTTRKLHFLSFVLCHSRLLYLQFALSQSIDHWLTALQNALFYCGGVPSQLIFDNLKTAVHSHVCGQDPKYHPRFLDFCAHFGIEPVACNVGSPQEKGRVESGVGYIKKNLLAGLSITALGPLEAHAREWLETIANSRIHATTHRQPREHFEQTERSTMRPCPFLPYDCSLIQSARANNQAFFRFEANRYSVPPAFAGHRLQLHMIPERIEVFAGPKLDQHIASHARSFQRHLIIQHPDHQAQLLSHRVRAREAQLLLDFQRLSSRADAFWQGLQRRTPNPRHHIRQILALVQIHGEEAVNRALADAIELHAYSSDYIQNILHQRRHAQEQTPPGPLHLTRRADLLELTVPPADMTLYTTPQLPPTNSTSDPENTTANL